MTTTVLPPFLHPWHHGSPSSPGVSYISACHRSNRLSLSSHALWWPSRDDNASAVAILIPGNPGLVDFYVPFLTSLYDKCNGTLPIVACGLVGHSPGVQDDRVFRDPSSVCLLAQTNHLVELVDTLKGLYDRVVLIGHSIGAWLSLQVLRARPDAVHNLFLLFPTISHIATTPRGRSLSWLFHPPLPRLISLASYATRLLSLRVLSRLFPDWPQHQLLVLRSLLDSPSAVYSALTLAHDEMINVKEPDIPLLQTFSDRIHLYYAEEDGWVGERKALLLKELELHMDIKVVHGSGDIPHAFVINHGEPLASQCYDWLCAADLVEVTSTT